MKIFFKVRELQKYLNSSGLSPRGFVPTMGALHPGHISLVKASLKECPVTVVSIFVNPTQFNDKKDLERYPRDSDKDLALLRETLGKNDVVFMPSEKEIYPSGPQKKIYDFGNLDKAMEGIYRPGHFNGVAQVVSILFDIIKPDIAYFGQKDFQQLAIIKKLIIQKEYKIKITTCPIIRESDGLAMSSRNILLEPAHRKNAGIIYRTISEAAAMIHSSEISDIKKHVSNSINSIPGFRVEYFEIVDETELIPVNEKKLMKQGRKYYGCIAVWAGNVRLIDNTEFHFPVSKG